MHTARAVAEAEPLIKVGTLFDTVRANDREGSIRCVQTLCRIIASIY